MTPIINSLLLISLFLWAELLDRHISRIRKELIFSKIQRTTLTKGIFNLSDGRKQQCVLNINIYLGLFALCLYLGVYLSTLFSFQPEITQCTLIVVGILLYVELVALFFTWYFFPRINIDNPRYLWKVIKSIRSYQIAIAILMVLDFISAFI